MTLTSPMPTSPYPPCPSGGCLVGLAAIIASYTPPSPTPDYSYASRAEGNFTVIQKSAPIDPGDTAGGTGGKPPKPIYIEH